MDKEELKNSHPFEALTGVQIWQKLYGKELNCKKHILEYTEMVRLLKNDELNPSQLEATYNFIYEHIEKLKGTIKPNTMMFLKNSLKKSLGKYVKKKDPLPMNYFMEFFKKAYPANKRRRDYTRVLMDISTISDEQIWTTLTYINRECLKNKLKLSRYQKIDIVEIIELGISRGSIKFINNIKSLKKLNEELKIYIVSKGDEHHLRYK